jgi:thiosulfate/3-mercaptopyruvate sulfurtransferase
MYAKPDSLIDPDELARRLDDPALAIVEVDEDTAAYAKDHIPGAVALDWEHELHARPRRDFVSGEALARLLGGKGVRSEQTIVLYGGNNNWFAAYAYWLMRLRGVDTVRLLNGGRKAWELQSRPMTAERPDRPPATFRLGSPRPDLRVFRDEVVTRARAGAGTFVDVRSPAEFSGELLAPAHLPQEQPYVAGHVPGAHNIPWAKAANDDGTFKSPGELRALYEGAGVLPATEVVTYCRIGERSAHTWFVLSELLGHDRVRNYDGSWTEYGSLVDVPVEVG